MAWRTDGRTDGQTDRWTDGWTDWLTDWWTDGWTDGRTDWLTDGWTDRWTDGLTDGWTDRWTDRRSINQSERQSVCQSGNRLSLRQFVNQSVISHPIEWSKGLFVFFFFCWFHLHLNTLQHFTLHSLLAVFCLIKFFISPVRLSLPHERSYVTICASWKVQPKFFKFVVWIIRVNLLHP